MRLSRDAMATASYVAIQALAVVVTILFIRFGQQGFGLSWVLGSILAMGWGTMILGITSPALASQIWSIPAPASLLASFRGLALALLPIVIIPFIPLFRDELESLSHLNQGWMTAFFLVGLLRGHAQLLSTLSVRRGGHGTVIGFQLSGRLIELCVVSLASANGHRGWMLAGWLAYPAAQYALVAAEWRSYRNLPVPEGAREGGGKVLGITIAGQLLELVMPALWFRMGGESVFVAYRAVSGALANSLLLPRYWYVLSPDKVRTDAAGFGLSCMVIATALVLTVAFQVASDAVAFDVCAWSMVPLVVNGAVLATFSRMRQSCLNQGQITAPVLAILGGRAMEVCLLAVLTASALLPPPMAIVAYSGYAVCVPLLSFLNRKAIQCSTTS